MDYTYNLTEIRTVIDSWLQYTLDTTVQTADQHTGGTANTPVQSTEKPGLENWRITDSPLKSSTPLTKVRQRKNTSVDLAESGSQERSESNFKMEILGEREDTASESSSNKDDVTVDSEDMSLKLVLTYLYYMDTSPDNSDKPAEKTSPAVKSDNCTDTRINSTSSNSECDADSDSDLDSLGLSDADIDSLGHSESDSYKLASFSMMNIFDSTCDTNYALTGSLDLCRDPCSDSDKDTLDWLSDSSEDDSKSEEREEDIVLDSDLNDEPTELFSTSMCSSSLGQTQSSDISGISDIKRYSGSTYSIGQCNSEIRQKLVKRLFRKVFPSKKYVVNK